MSFAEVRSLSWVERKFLTTRLIEQWSDQDEMTDDVASLGITHNDPSNAIQPAEGVPPGVSYGVAG